MSARRPRRSHEPVVWLLFAAGGMLAAMGLPALIVVIGLAGPTGLLGEGVLHYDRILGLVGSPVGKLVAFVSISLLFWHAMHRIFHGLHDLGIDTRGKGYRFISYGFALLATLVTACLLLMLQA
jgi:fumarate reductase subunit D